MDSLTQIVLGGAIGNALLGKKIKNRAVLYGAIAGTIPDLDIFASLFTDPISALEIHRTITHSLLFAFLSSLLFGYFLFKIENKNGITYKESYWLFFWGFITHAILDVFTTWGTQVLWPFNYSFAFKSIFVIDPLYTLPFIYFLVRSMREKKDMQKRMYFNNLGLYVSSSYLVLTLLLKAFAFYKFTDTLTEKNITYKSISVKPTLMNTVMWKAIVETEEEFLIGDHSLLSNQPITFKVYQKNAYLAKSLEENLLLQRLLKLTEHTYTFSKNGDDLYLNDLRFGVLKETENEIQFAFSYRFYTGKDGEWQVEEVKKEKRDGIVLIKNVWNRILRND